MPRPSSAPPKRQKTRGLLYGRQDEGEQVDADRHNRSGVHGAHQQPPTAAPLDPGGQDGDVEQEGRQADRPPQAVVEQHADACHTAGNDLVGNKEEVDVGGAEQRAGRQQEVVLGQEARGAHARRSGAICRSLEAAGCS